MRKFLIVISAFVALGNPYSFSQANELRFFRIATGGIAGTYYPIGGLVAHAISNPPDARPCNKGGSCGPSGLVMIAQAANGSVANVRDIQQGKVESGFAQSDVAHWAYTGTGKFKKEKPKHDLRTIANLYVESIHIVARKDAGIKRVKDLIGKRVSLDEAGSGTLVDAELVLKAYGISRDDIQVEYVKPDLAIRRIRENKLDAFFIVAGYPAKAVSELAGDVGVDIVPINGPAADELVSRYRFFSFDHIPQGIYQGVPRVETLSVGAQWLVSATIDDVLVYEITQALWNPNTRLLLDGGHPKGRQITIETALKGIAVPLHPGARRYYQEVGLSIK